MELGHLHRVYFIGIGGIGMSALAKYFLAIGKEVSGYDKTRTPFTQSLEALGMEIHYEDMGNAIAEKGFVPGTTLVVYTPAVPINHGEFQYFNSNGFMLKKRSEVLGLVTRSSYCLAVAGTHGKTTTSSILAHILAETDIPLTAFLGGVSEDFHDNFYFTGTDYAVVEADEFDRSFLRLSPDLACITSMDADHLDIYGTVDALRDAFHDFADRIRPKGKLFVRKGLPMDGITFGIEDDADFCIRNIQIKEGGYRFDIHMPGTVLEDVFFPKPGRHNLLNALAAFAMAVQVGKSPMLLARALGSFKGVERRFSYQVKTDDFVFVDDYAHHPAEIDAVSSAVAEMYPNKKVLAVFQPHLFSRTRDFGKAFAESLSKFENVLLLDIYPAREEPIAGITSDWLLELMPEGHKKHVNKANLAEEIRAISPQVLVTMGAGDIGLEVPHLKKEFEHGI